MHNGQDSNPQKAGWVGERRRDPRRRVLLQGKIVFPHNSFSSDCLIRDLSPGGARIGVDTASLSQDPYLIVVRDALVHETRTMWTQAQQAGLRFSANHGPGR